MRAETELTAVFAAAGPAHHQAHLATDGDHPEWPLWYANHVIDDVRRISNHPDLTVSLLVYLLVDADRTYRSSDSSLHWSEFYAQRVIADLANG